MQITLLANTKTSVLANNVVNTIGEQWKLKKKKKSYFVFYISVLANIVVYTVNKQLNMTKNNRKYWKL